MLNLLTYRQSVLGVDVKRLEDFYQKEIQIADRFLVESAAETIYAAAVREDGMI